MNERSRTQGLTERLHTPGPLYSALMMIPDPAVASVLGSCGLDFVSVDGEHGEYSPDAMRACVDTLKDVPTPVIVRPATNDDADLRHVLDLASTACSSGTSRPPSRCGDRRSGKRRRVGDAHHP
jgi:2-keto-3-deoxy-L-rhamnonate aldolase RhmA